MITPILKKEWSWGNFQVFDQQPNFDIVRVKQIHGNKILNYDQLSKGKTNNSNNNNNNNSIGIQEADGIVIVSFNKNTPITLPIAILTADCLPILVKGKYGIAMIHAGWRGVQQKIIGQSDIQKIEPEYFFIGPHIRQCCYQVGKEFKDYFPNSRNFKDDHFSMIDEIVDQITSFYPSIDIKNIEDCKICTFDNKLFHSYRRDKNDKRNWNIFH